MVDKVIAESKKPANRAAICLKCWIWCVRPQDKKHEGRNRIHKGNTYRNGLICLDCALVTKKEYSVDLAKKENKNLSEAQYREKTIESLRSLALKHANYIPEENKMKLLEVEAITTESMDDDDNNKTRKSTTNFDKKLGMLNKSLEGKKPSNDTGTIITIKL